MIDYKPLLIRELNAILPTYYELFVDSTTETPCITIMESNNSAQEEGDNIRFSLISFNIKIWADDLNVIAEKGMELDQKMFELGFSRISYTELWMGNQCSAIFRYEILANENY